MQAQKLIRLANQIAIFMSSKPHGEAVQGLADHISDYWEPRMRKQLFELTDAKTEGILPLVHEAIPSIRKI